MPQVLLARPGLMLALLGGAVWLVMALAGIVAGLAAPVWMATSLALAGWAQIVFGARLHSALDRYARGDSAGLAAQHAVEALLDAETLAELDTLWRQTLLRVLAPGQMTAVAAPSALARLEAGDLLVPAVQEGGWYLAQPRRRLRHYDHHDLALVLRLWPLFERVRRALLDHAEGQRAERHRLATRLAEEIERPLQGIADDPAADDFRPLLDQALAELAAVRVALQGVETDARTLFENLRAECQRRAAEASVRCAVSVAVEGNPVIGARAAAALGRAVGEVLTNSLRHAGAGQWRIEMRASAQPAGWSLTLEDDGCGFDSAAVAPGMGLRNLTGRMQALGGAVQVSSAVGAGTRVALRWPDGSAG